MYDCFILEIISQLAQFKFMTPWLGISNLTINFKLYWNKLNIFKTINFQPSY